MTKLLEIKEILKAIYSKHDSYILPIIKFLLALIVFMSINGMVGEMRILNNFMIVIILALFCSFLPVNIIVVLAVIMTLLHLYAISLAAVVVGGALGSIMLLLYFRFETKDGLALILMPLAFGLKIPYAIPLIFGLIGSPFSGIGIGCGVIAYYFLRFVSENASHLTFEKIDEIIPKINLIVEYLLKNKLMLVTLFTCILVVVAVYIIKRLSVDYAWTIAIAAGGILNIIVMLIGEFALDISGGIGWLLLSTILSIFIAIAVQFFVFNVDYTRSENVQFEDEDYYYYVKVVPKITISAPNLKVKKINVQKKETEEMEEIDIETIDMIGLEEVAEDEIML